MEEKILDQIQNIFNELKPECIYKTQIKAMDYRLTIQGQTFNIDPKANVYLLAMGKAAAFEAKAIYEILQNTQIKLKDALVITKYNHSLKDLPFTTIEASHPLVDESSLNAGTQALSFIEKIKENDFLIFCLSGGASALVESFQDGIDLQRMQRMNQTLLNSGISIENFNLIRKSLSKIKNGGLFKNLKSSSISLITCDIPSGNIESVSSAPSIYTPIDQKKVNELIENYLEPEDIKFFKKYVCLNENSYTHGSIFKIADANYLGSLAKKYLEPAVNSLEVLEPVFDTSLDVGKEKIIESLVPDKCQVSLGELNIKVQGNGLGGRSTHFVLNLAYDLFYLNKLSLTTEQLKKLFILSVGTDGSDGPTDAAGAYFSYNEFKKCTKQAIEEELSKFDSYHFFQRLNTLIKTKATGTNLMDLRVICI